MTRHLPLLALGLALCAWAPPSPGRACSCAEMSPAEAIERAELVAEVEAGDASPVAPEVEAQAATTSMLLVRVWKGGVAPGRELSVRAGTVPAACGVVFERRRRYLLLAYRSEDGRWRTDSCSHTRPIERAGPELEILEADGDRP